MTHYRRKQQQVIADYHSHNVILGRALNTALFFALFPFIVALIVASILKWSLSL
jgi:hypothetical protein